MSFENLGLAPETLRAVEDAGYTTPTPIQTQAIPSVLMGKDIMGIAQTGTGKTAGFTLPMIDILSQGRARARMPRSLILEPTRELAAQVAENFEIYGKYHKLNMALLIGGVSFDDQDRKLDRGVDVLIATPGRLLDHFERGKLMMSGVEILVVDEADRMLDMGFIPDVERICSLMPQRHQTLFFSATMAKEIKRLADRFLKDPKRIEVASPSSTAENVEQFQSFIKSTAPQDKRARLREIIQGEDLKNAIVFCNRKRDVDVLFRSLKKHGFNAAALHGDMNQSARMEVLAGFKNDSIQLLIASDVAARGLDIPAVSHVFNFDVPSHPEDYIHRIGRTGRAGRSGRAFTLVTPADSKYLRGVQQLIGRDIPPAPGEKGAKKPDATPAAPSAEQQSAETGSTEQPPAQTNNAEPTPEASSDAPREARSRSGRRRGRRSKDSSGNRTEQQTTGTSEAKPAEPRNEPQSRPQNEKSQSRPQNEKSRSRSQNEPQKRSQDRRSGRDRSSDDQGGKPVIGLGDHVPEFLKQPIEQKPAAAPAKSTKKPRTRRKKAEAA